MIVKKGIVVIFSFLLLIVNCFYFPVSVYAQPAASQQANPSTQYTKSTRQYIPLSNNISLMSSRDTGNGSRDTIILKDYLSSSRVIVDDRGEDVRTLVYYPYGEQMSNVEFDRLFTSHRKLPNLSVYHAAARFYSPTLGQFIQPDIVEGPNRYVYVKGNPIFYFDPSGQKSLPFKLDQQLRRVIFDPNIIKKTVEKLLTTTDIVLGYLNHYYQRKRVLEYSYGAEILIAKNPENIFATLLEIDPNIEIRPLTREELYESGGFYSNNDHREITFTEIEIRVDSVFDDRLSDLQTTKIIQHEAIHLLQDINQHGRFKKKSKELNRNYFNKILNIDLLLPIYLFDAEIMASSAVDSNRFTHQIKAAWRSTKKAHQ